MLFCCNFQPVINRTLTGEKRDSSKSKLNRNEKKVTCFTISGINLPTISRIMQLITLFSWLCKSTLTSQSKDIKVCDIRDEFNSQVIKAKKKANLWPPLYTAYPKAPLIRQKINTDSFIWPTELGELLFYTFHPLIWTRN